MSWGDRNAEVRSLPGVGFRQRKVEIHMLLPPRMDIIWAVELSSVFEGQNREGQ
jgi:hypothetical protein